MRTYNKPIGKTMTGEEIHEKIKSAIDSITPAIHPIDPLENSVAELLISHKYILAIETAIGSGVSLHPDLSRQATLHLLAKLFAELSVTGSENCYIWAMAMELHCGKTPECVTQT